MRIGRIWDFIMRRKTQIFVPFFLLVVIMVSVIGSFMPHFLAGRRNVIDQNESAIIYNNSLILSISSSTGSTAYSLEFQDNFQSASIAIYPEKLPGEAYIRIFDEDGVLVKGEYTTIKEPAEVDQNTPSTDTDALASRSNSLSSNGVSYLLTEELKKYTLNLQPGYILELHSSSKNQASFLSTLDQVLATEFLPSSETERYVVMPNGLKKLSWDDTTASDALYSQLQRYLTNLIANYQTIIDDETLNHKTADLARKTQVIHAYQTLKEADRIEFAEFIDHLRRGGSPVITYTGSDTYYINESIDFADYVVILDNEDGEIPISNLQIAHEINWSQPGDYTVELTASDSDHNITILSLTLTLVKPNDDSELPDSPDSPDSPDDPGSSDITDIPNDPSTPDDQPPDDTDLPDDSNASPDSPEAPDTTPPAQLPQPLPPNDPSQSLGNLTYPSSSATEPDDKDNNSQAPTAPVIPSGIGTNAPIEPEEEPSTPTQVWDNNRPEPIITSTPSEETSPTEEFNWKTLFPFVIGIIFLILIIKFIFDHYVR